MGDLAAGENLRQHADHFAACGESCGHCTHQADVGSAVDDAQAGVCDGRAEGDGLGAIGRMVAVG